MIRLRCLAVFAAPLVLLLAACSHTHSTATTRSSATMPVTYSALVGTWRFESATNPATGVTTAAQVNFFMRFYKDGSVASWPVSKDQAGSGYVDTNGVSIGSYQVENGSLMVSPNRTLAHVRISDDQFSYVESDGSRVIYRHLASDLEPGVLPK